ncbi:MAG TPA: hypothetical protein VFZ16_02295, partial [Hyphomicrobiaceae bacterium]|nr:hypothetical protein [Hyphomicrobiaceae bacterium]
ECLLHAGKNGVLAVYQGAIAIENDELHNGAYSTAPHTMGGIILGATDVRHVWISTIEGIFCLIQ